MTMSWTRWQHGVLAGITTGIATIGIATIALAAVAGGCGKKPKEEPTTVKQDEPDPGPAPEASDDEAPVEAGTTEPERADLGETIYFEFDSSTLDEQSRATLENNATWLREDASRTLTIQGHTDEVGTTEYNIALGDRRAKAAHDYLVRLGVDAGRVKTISYGEERPASTADSKNRRDVFIATR